MLYCNSESGRIPDSPVEACAGMKWFRSNIRLGSRLALFALAIQFLLSFGHFHGGSAQAAPSLVGHHDSVGLAAIHSDASDRAGAQDAAGLVRLKSSSDREPNGQPTDDCAICAVMALANAMAVAAPPCLLGPQVVAFHYLTADAEFVTPHAARIAFQPRAPPPIA